jgi:hypothetical protein
VVEVATVVVAAVAAVEVATVAVAAVAGVLFKLSCRLNSS